MPAHAGPAYVIPDTGNLRSETGTSTFPGYSLTVEGGGKFQNSGSESRKSEEFQNFGQEDNLPPELEGAGPEKIYQSLTGIRPKKLQREHLQAQIQENNTWYTTIQHWIFHGWNPKNITGMIELY